MSVGTFTGHPWIAVEGLPNARDLGGIPLPGGGSVRRGRLYRGGSPAAVTRRGLASAVEELRIATVLDLRVAAEIERHGAGPFADDPRVEHVVVGFGADPQAASLADLDDGDDLLGTLYEAGLDDSTDPLRRVLTAIAGAVEAPLLFHCQAGQDRTGVVAATLLGLLGASDDDIVADYLLTRTWLLGQPPESREARREAISGFGLRDGALDPQECSIRRYLGAVVDRWGSAEAMALDIGVSPQVIATLRGALTV